MIPHLIRKEKMIDVHTFTQTTATEGETITQGLYENCNIPNICIIPAFLDIFARMVKFFSQHRNPNIS
jgi:hypothetical protein